MLGLDSEAQREVAAGLCAAGPAIASKYLYDPLGCRLFEAITHLPEYYPTRTELAIMARQGAAIGRSAGTGAALIELGAGNCQKARALFPTLQPARYVAIDISAHFLRQSLRVLQSEFPAIPMIPLAADLTAPFELPAALNGTRRLFFYPGSSIGNFDPEDALALLARVRRLCEFTGSLLVGIDLVKDAAVLHRAYNDGLGLTAAFNRNVLSHCNALVGSDFRLSDWRHRAFYNAARSRIEMHLDAVRAATVSWPGGCRRFRSGDSIHTENSYKYEIADFSDLLRAAGFAEIDVWTDERRWFAVCHASA
ncbi:MAG: L-histidine N(alpha)-methyltransferase [Rhodocyclales bacterium]|nr:L-histidine N(alpha)-methyltransferase [Rhodocyclales bacterium]